MTSNKSRLVALILNIFLGLLGVHRMYVGKNGTGLIQLLLTISFIGVWITAIWAFIDLLLILTGSFQDASGAKVTRWDTA